MSFPNEQKHEKKKINKTKKPKTKQEQKIFSVYDEVRWSDDLITRVFLQY
jgi:hypothetical protein